MGTKTPHTSDQLAQSVRFVHKIIGAFRKSGNAIADRAAPTQYTDWYPVIHRPYGGDDADAPQRRLINVDHNGLGSRLREDAQRIRAGLRACHIKARQPQPTFQGSQYILVIGYYQEAWCGFIVHEDILPDRQPFERTCSLQLSDWFLGPQGCRDAR
ncbi:hypothetical protein NIIDMKKI_28850 [Mycobacterium kansasii]|uniref:Uncharacterized protein n=1 Tax=Mycobacterium kansasii TaxID=1768 RepID=A0A7G1IDP9_MYCKA|nr:hypothetical protein NIIDMKKI_28850 [Mycobacterium kansasii]